MKIRLPNANRIGIETDQRELDLGHYLGIDPSDIIPLDREIGSGR